MPREVPPALQRSLERSVGDLDHAISLDPGSSLAFLERGSLYRSWENIAGPSKISAKPSSSFPGTRVAILAAVMSISTRASMIAQSRISTSRSNCDPPCPAGFYVRGHVYDLKGQHDRAKAEYDRAIELDPDPGNAAAFVRRARSYEGKRDYDRAIQDLDQALKLEPRNAVALNNRCFVRARAGAFRRCPQGLR